jgi:hypothetical protein
MEVDDAEAHELACWMIDLHGAAALGRLGEIVRAHQAVGEPAQHWERIAGAAKAILTGHRDEAPQADRT